MKSVILGVLGVGIGLGGGYLLGKRSPMKSNTRVSQAENSSQQGSSESGNDLLSLCFLGNENQDEMFKLDGKAVRFSELPMDFRSSYLTTMEESYRRHLDLVQKTAIRLRLASNEGKLKNVSDLPTIEDMLPEKTQVTEKEIKDYYEANKAGFPKTMTFDKVKPSLMGHLTEMKKRSVQEELKTLLSDSEKISWNLAPQCPPSFQFDVSSRPTLGDQSAGNVVLFLTDFMCPECRVVWPRLEGIMRESSAKIKVAPVLLTQEGNQYASEFNRALFCASKEGDAKFVQFMNLAHTMPINYQNNLEKIKEHIKVEIAKEMQIDGEALEACMRTPDADKFVADAVVMTKSMSGFRLPTIFLNGRTVFAGNTAEGSTDLLKKVVGM